MPKIAAINHAFKAFFCMLSVTAPKIATSSLSNDAMAG